MSNKETVRKIDLVEPSDLASELFHAPVAVAPNEHWTTALATMGINQGLTESHPSILPSLLRSHALTINQSTAEQLNITFLGYAPVQSRSRVFHGDGCDWVMMSLREDPLYYASGRKLVTPKPVHDELRRIVRAGINFDAMFIAHEVPAGSVKDGQAIPLELIAPPPPPEVMERMDRLGRQASGFWSGIAQTLRRVGDAASQTAVAVGSSLAAIGSVTFRDPILFGVRFERDWRVDGRPLGMWYYLTHWYWPIAEEKS